jgi:hypothetical protein
VRSIACNALLNLSLSYNEAAEKRSRGPGASGSKTKKDANETLPRLKLCLLD